MTPPTQPKVKAKFTNTDGQKKIVYADGTSEYNETPATFKGEDANSGVITSDMLSGGQDFDIPEAPPSTSVEGGLAQIEEQTNQYTSGLESRAEADKAKESSSFDDLVSQFNDAPTQTGLEDKEYSKEGGVDTIQTELDDINNQILQEQQSLRRRLETIDEKGGGLQSGASAERDNLRRESLKTQADLSVIQMGVQGRFDSAKTIADRAVTAQMEQAQRKIDVLQLTYDRNKSLFDTSEQRAFESAQADRQNALDAEKETKTQINNLAIEALKAGATPTVAKQIMGSKTFGEALGLGGSYLMPKADAPKAPTLQDFGTSDAPNWKQYDPATGQWVAISGLDSVPTVTSPLAVASAKTKVNNMMDVAKNGGLESAVGPNAFARASFDEAFTAKRSNFVASVQSLTAELVVGNLIQKKAEGATFGALNEQEFGVIKDSATKINQWAIKGKAGTPEEGKIIGYKTTEQEFKKEWDNIQNYGKVDALLKGADPESIGVTVTDDGKYWTRDSNGKMVDLEELGQTEFDK